MKFEIDPFRKHCLINGLDDIGLTMEKKSSIDTYEAKAQARARLGLISIFVRSPGAEDRGFLFARLCVWR